MVEINKIQLNVYAVNNFPEIDIQPGYIKGNSTINLDLDVEIDSEKKVWEHACIFKLQAEFIAYLRIENDKYDDLESLEDKKTQYLLTIDISSLQLNITEVLESNIGEVNIKMMNRLIIIISKTIKYSINLLFGRGLHIGAFLPVDIDFGTVDFTLKDNYMLLQATPKFDSSTNRKKISKFLEQRLEGFDLLEHLVNPSDHFKKAINKQLKSTIMKHDLVKLIDK